MLKIMGSVTSPFTRLVRVICEELALAYEFEITAPFGKLDNAQDTLIGAQNPLLKVPVLIDDNKTIIDSRIIAKYLCEKAVITQTLRMPYPQNWHEENLMTVIYGVIDAGILQFMLQYSHPELDVSEGYLGRLSSRITRSLEWLNQQAELGKSFGVPEATLICGLEWFQKRAIVDWAIYPQLVKMHTAYSQRDSFKLTAIPADA